jgi:SET family sugar efflux transporter-like MFS transporter
MSGFAALAARRVPFVGQILGKHEYRMLLVLIIILALATSASTPLLSLYLVDQVGVGLVAAGLFSASIALPGLLLGIAVGRRSDRWSSRLPFLRGGVLWVAAGWLILAGSPFPWLTLAVGALFLSLGGALMGLVFATLHDVMARDGEERPAFVNTIVRTGWSLGYVFGILVGVQFAASFGFRGAFLATAALHLLCLLPLAALSVPVAVRVVAGVATARRGLDTGDILLFAFTGLCALTMSGQGFKNTYLPLAVTTTLGGTVGTYGTLVAVPAIIELVAIPLVGVIAVRIGLARLIASGIILGIVEYAIMSGSSAVWQLYVAQAIDAWVIAVILGLGVTYAQRLTPTRPGAASGLFFSTFNIATVIGGVLGAATVPFLGLPRVFLLPAILCVVALGVFVWVERRARDIVHRES